MRRGIQVFARRLPDFVMIASASLVCTGSGEPAKVSKVLGSDSCSTSGCHGGAGPNRGAHTIWKNFDPHFGAAATLTNGRSRAMAAQLGIGNAAESESCTACHAPMKQVSPSMFADPAVREAELTRVSCANCHGGAENWLLSHTRPDYPEGALAKLGMRQLGSPYERANSCVACHQNLDDDLLAAKHPPLIFELDGLLVAEPKHWREKDGFSHVQTWLVGQAVALREAAAQAKREPGERRTAEIEAIRSLLKATGTGWDSSDDDLVQAADNYAKKISRATMRKGQGRGILAKLIENREPFQADAFGAVAGEYRMWAKGHYAERLVLAIDRLNESLAATGGTRAVAKGPLDELFDAAKPPKSFDAAAVEHFVEKLDAAGKVYLDDQ